MYDIIVVGGGPAGLTAAVYGLRSGKSVFVIEKSVFGGQIVNSPKVENIPGFDSISGDDFADKMLDQAMNQGAEVTLEDVTSVVKSGDTFTVETAEGGNYEGRTVILATGTTHRTLGLEGEEDLIGSGISFCAVCDGDFYRDKKVVSCHFSCKVYVIKIYTSSPNPKFTTSSMILPSVIYNKVLNFRKYRNYRS